jgi:hypothetical protein
MEPVDFMLRRRARIALTEDDAPAASLKPQRGRPALLLAPVPARGMRAALPGERPPSKYAPGEDDGVIRRFDAYSQAYWSGRVKHGR